MKKMVKDVKATIRINKFIKKMIEKDGKSVQSILDDYIKKNYNVTIRINNKKQGVEDA